MSPLQTAAQIAGVFFLVSGIAFCALGVLGVYRMPDVYTRMHAGSKTIAVGAPLALLGVAFLSPADVTLKALTVIAFLLLTTPVATIATARAAHVRDEAMSEHTVRDDLRRDRQLHPAEERPEDED